MHRIDANLRLGFPFHFCARNVERVNRELAHLHVNSSSSLMIGVEMRGHIIVGRLRRGGRRIFREVTSVSLSPIISLYKYFTNRREWRARVDSRVAKEDVFRSERDKSPRDSTSRSVDNAIRMSNVRYRELINRACESERAEIIPTSSPSARFSYLTSNGHSTSTNEFPRAEMNPVTRPVVVSLSFF